MHERTQRAIAQLLFVFCCAIPTSFTLLCVLVTWTPWYHQRALRGIESELSRQAGLVVQIDDFRRSAPASLHLSGVRMVHPETLREVATVREVDWVTRDDEVAILLHQPELQSSQLESAWRLIHDRFLCRPEQTSRPVQFAANDLTIHSRSGSMTLRDVDAWLRQIDQSVEATIQCVPANEQSGSPIMIAANRDRSLEIPATRWTLDTGGIALPCSALAEYLAPLQMLGDKAEFKGTMQWHWTAAGWTVDLGSGRFDHVALDRIFENQSHRLSGTASIELSRCRIDPQQQLSDIVGTIHARNGQVGRSLLLSAQQYLGFDTRFPDGVGDVPYDLIALGFDINNQQLELTGICHRDPAFPNVGANVVLCMNGFPLVRSSEQVLDAVAIHTAIAPSHAALVPTSRQTGWLSTVLIPPSRPLPGGESRIRSAQRYHGGPTIEQPASGNNY